MLADDKIGNMREVFLEASKIQEIEDRINQRDMRQGPFVAELTPEAKGEWIIVITTPGQESIASGHLIGRRFGVYQPRYFQRSVRRGRLVERMLTLFPNYLFVHVWNVNRHLGRVLACTGVNRVLLLGDRPATVPWKIIDDIRAEENSRNPMNIPYYDEFTGQAKSKKKRKKIRKNKKAHRKDALEQAEVLAVAEGNPNDVVAAYSWGIRFGAMPEQERVGALHKALGLPA